MMVIWTIAKKDLQLLLRDTRALLILLVMPLFFILVLGVSLGEGFGKKSAEGLRVSVLNLDAGVPRAFDRPAMLREGAAWLAATVDPAAGPAQALAAANLACVNHQTWFPHDSWSDLMLRDLGETAGIRVELIKSREEAQHLVRTGKRPAVLVLGPHFSRRVARCSFLSAGGSDAFTKAALLRAGDPVLLAVAGCYQETQTALPLYLTDGLNPFFRDGVKLDVLDVLVLKDETQQTAAAIIDQVAQGSLLRVVMPWMIGRAFEKLGDPAFLAMLGREQQLPAPVKFFILSAPAAQKRALGAGLQNGLQNLFPNYNLTAKTWAALTKEAEHTGAGMMTTSYQEEGRGWLKRGALRYQLLVPS